MAFRIKLENVPKVVLGARFAALVVAFLLIVNDFATLGLILALVVLIIGLALRNIRVKAWLIEVLTGIPKDAILQLDQQRRAGEPLSQSVTLGAVQPNQRATQGVRLSQSQLDALLDAHKKEGIALRRVWPLDGPIDQNSWLGGLPKLPDSMEWPVNPQTGFALHHLAQIDLTEMPRPEDGPHLPDRGTLFFFADVNENMCWDEGPDMPEAAVLYTPEATADLPLRAPPRTLPEIDHRETEMESALWGFRTPVRRVHLRWPVTGHLIDTWDEENFPEGVDHRSGYYEAQVERTKEVRNAVLGVAPDQPMDKPLLKDQQGPKTQDGTPQRSRIYHPENYGTGFPFNVAVATEVLRFALHEARSDHQDAVRAVEADKKNDRASSKFNLDRLAAADRFIPDASGFIDRLGTLDPAGGLSPEDHAAFETLIKTHGQSSTGYGWLWRPTNAIQRVVTRGIYDRALLDNIPQDALARIAHISHPGQDNARHYMLGAKGTGSNPTAGRGVRLLQLDSDYAVEFMFCDVGIVDFWIDAEDLAAGRWDRAWAATAGG